MTPDQINKIGWGLIIMQLIGIIIMSFNSVLGWSMMLAPIPIMIFILLYEVVNYYTQTRQEKEK